MEIGESKPTEVPLWQRLIAGRRPKRALIRASIPVALAIILFPHVFLPVYIRGISMEPTYHDGKINMINRQAYRWSKPKRGDVVCIKASGIHLMYFKRIIGLPSETLSITNGTVYIDGRPLDEPYVRNRYPWEEPPRKLEADEYYLIGDNRGMPQEQHDKGVASADHIAGKALW